MRSLAGTPVFLIGIGGSGMAPLAKFAALAGARVSGSDRGLADAPAAQLADLGVRVFRTHARENLDAVFEPRSDSQSLIVYSTAIAPDHIERAAGKALADAGRARLLHRMDFLNECLGDVPEAFCVAGTHGKTSSSSMAGWVLLQLGLDPHIIVGGQPLYLPMGIRCGAASTRTGACETDESDGSFLKAQPGLRLVLNIDRDHLDHYGDFPALCQAFGDFVRRGRLCALNALDPELVKIAAGFRQADGPELVGFAAHAVDPADAPGAADWPTGLPLYRGTFSGASDRLRVTSPGANAAFAAELQLRMPGRHFASNALGVFALIDASVRSGRLRCPDYTPERVIAALNAFPGVERRMQLLGEHRGVAVYDDYGHHPTELRAVIAACRLRVPAGRRLLVVFQPHRYTRTAALYSEFAEALGAADRLFLLPLYSAGEAPQPGIDSAMIAREWRGHHSPGNPGQAYVSPVAFATGSSNAQSFAQIFDAAEAGDLLLCLGAGDISAGVRAFIDANRESA